MSQGTGSPKKKRPRKSQKSDAEKERGPEAAWKIARLAAILSTRIPLPRSVEMPGWDEGPPEAEEAMELIGHQRQDGIYVSCLRRARFLLEAAEGTGRIHAADLFDEKAAYSISEIEKRFESVDWRDFKQGVSIKKLIKNIGESARERLALEGLDMIVENELSEMISLIRQREEPPQRIQFGLLLKLCERHGILYEKLVRKRENLQDPPVSRFLSPGEGTSDALGIHRNLKIHYNYLLDLKSPWMVTEVADGDELLTIALEHKQVCPQCGGRCAKGEESVEKIEGRVLKRKVTIRVRSAALTCPKHDEFARPYEPPELPRGEGG